MSFETVTNNYAIEDVGALTDYIKVLSSLSVANESQRTLRGVMPVVVADPDFAAARKLQSDFAGVAAVFVEGTTEAHLLAATIACVRGTLAGPIILNTSTAHWVGPDVTLGNAAASGLLGGGRLANLMTGKEQVAGSIVEWKGIARKVAETMGLIQAVHQYASLAPPRLLSLVP